MRVKFFTLGCKVNQYETQALQEKFLSRGYKITDSIADLYVVNTCTVTSRADTKSIEAVLCARKENPQAKIAVCGCFAQLNREKIEKLGVDYIVPQDRKPFLVDSISSQPDTLFCENNYEYRDNIWSLNITKFFNRRAFVKIQDGCNNYCSFCKIPYIRGNSSSRRKHEVIEEIKTLSQCHGEIVLCGINLGLYGRDLSPPQRLENVIEEILEIPSLGRLRLSSLEPYLISDKLLSLFSRPKLCPHLHLPFQSADVEVLEKMNKKETPLMYEEIVGKAKEVNPEIAISCDIMVGFPYEDEGGFDNTVEFLKKVMPMRMHIFTFSPRENTPFFGFKVRNQKVIYRRHAFLRKLAEKFALEYKNRFVGKKLYMVAEQKSNGYTLGYTENYIRVCVEEDVRLGEIIPVRIKQVTPKGTFAYAL